MKFARRFLAVLAASALAACATDSPTAPSAPPVLEEVQVECGERIPQVQEDGSVIWVCAPHFGSGG